MFQNASRDQVRRLVDDGAQLLEVLERRQYELAHLPGAVSIPAWELTRDRADELDRTRPVVVYCFDTVWDLSPRAACLLELYGFSEVYDYVDGKADWMAYGLPVEGRDGPFLGSLVSEVPTCGVDGTVGDARRLLEGADDGAVVVVVAGGGLAVGDVDLETLEGHADSDPLLDVMDPVPTTFRPSATVASVADGGGGRPLVTTSDGRLLGQVVVAHHHDDQDDHEAEFDRQLAEVMEAIEERFGDREPSEGELRSFLYDRLVAEGRSPEDADRFLDELESGEPDWRGYSVVRRR